ncbi:pyruvate kinase [Chroococcidiopsis sp. TS-821]|uniref:pyruvate kinase n=1 Tax=Chroococcidiopsis sp. TS-821 TaxID=1378066 RepID=UPI000CEDE7F1|nr:pyruvate kinase [Chroococcidiopsis sp. TS-821]PPS45456.1 pyruvate kinase [Chroococcidiopsis sp. TS-821]
MISNSYAIKETVDLDFSDPRTLLQTLQQLRQSVHAEGQKIFNQWRNRISKRSFLISGLNLAYYLALRQHDLRQVQAALMPLGLSSLGRCEARVLPNLDAIIASLGAICRDRTVPPHPTTRAFFRGDRLLRRHTKELLGDIHAERWVRIMVTLPTEAASDYELVKDLLKRGTNCARINCAHDTSTEWEAMVNHVRKAEAETGQACKILMDLAGPKIRTADVMAFADRKRLYVGDRLLLTRDRPKPLHDVVFQARCTIPEVLEQVKTGQTVWIDDGEIGTEIESLVPEGILLRVTQTSPEGKKLKSDKGINFPDTPLTLKALTEKDCRDLDFVATHADIVGYSFVQTAADVELLQQELAARQQPQLGIIAKIETQKAVQNLPELIVRAAGKQPFGVMIARGDLAVEIGYQRMAEMQEEMLWISEAAHVPVIWATQVLENMAKKGIPSRAEMTDAAMAERAECVMLNKGSFIGEAVAILDDVLTRLQAHQVKKTPQLRALRSWF